MFNFFKSSPVQRIDHFKLQYKQAYDFLNDTHSKSPTPAEVMQYLYTKEHFNE